MIDKCFDRIDLYLANHLKLGSQYKQKLKIKNGSLWFIFYRFTIKGRLDVSVVDDAVDRKIYAKYYFFPSLSHSRYEPLLLLLEHSAHFDIFATLYCFVDRWWVRVISVTLNEIQVVV